MQVTEVLERGLVALQEDGWCQNAYTNEDGICISRALWLAISEEHDWLNGGRLLMQKSLRALAAQTGIGNIAMWNDHPDRTFSQVEECFRRAIAETELRELRAAA